MSHQLQGERAGLIDVEFDLERMDKIANGPLWLVMRGALQSNGKLVHRHYRAPISNTGAGVKYVKV